MIPKIVFILATNENTNNIKRIEEFIANGYDVEVYSFFRGSEVRNKPKSVVIQNIGEFSNDLPYKDRIGIMYKGIKSVLEKKKNENCIYYLIRTDVALLYMFISKKPYIYEEADMTHVTFKNKYIRGLFEYLDKRIIKYSLVSVFRSEGFLEYHFGQERPANTYVIPNRLDSSILTASRFVKESVNQEHLKFGFVGVIRYDTIKNISLTILKNFPQHEVHFYGVFGSQREELSYNELKSYHNCFFHGKFTSPEDLPMIYNSIDLVLSTYDLSAVNHRYAEPNKFYESIFFKTPIIVTTGGFLARKVKKLGVGFDIDITNEDKVISFIKSLSAETIKDKIDNASRIDQSYCINKNDNFFKLLNSKL